MKLFGTFILGVLSLGLMVSSVRADEIDNPQYNSWSKFGVGSSATLEGKMQAGPQTMTMEMKRSLKEKGDDSMTIEITTTIDIMGRQQTAPARTQKVTKTTEKKDISEVGNEKVEAAGKTYDCKVYEWKGMAQQAPGSTAKVWFSPEVPGGVVKMEVKTSRGDMTQILKSVEIK